MVSEDELDPKIKYKDKTKALAKLLWSKIIHKQNTSKAQQLHIKHPLRTHQFGPKKYKAFPFYHYTQLQNISKAMNDKYRALFIDFPPQGIQCNLCGETTECPLPFHLAIECNSLHDLRRNYWFFHRFQFARIGAQIGTIHQILYGQQIIDMLKIHSQHPHAMWKLRTGANWFNQQIDQIVCNFKSLPIENNKTLILTTQCGMLCFLFRLDHGCALLNVACEVTCCVVGHKCKISIICIQIKFDSFCVVLW